MRTQITDTSIKLWLSAADTYGWAHKPGASWPCSFIANKPLFAEFDSNGLLDIAINDGRDNQNIPSDEFNAITSDFLRPVLDEGNPAYFVAVGQFKE